MFGRDSEEARLQKAMRAVGADPVLVKNWFKTLDKMKKIAPNVRREYEEAYFSVEKLKIILQKMEATLSGTGGVLSEQELQMLRECKKKMRQIQGKCDHSFVISPDDKEFHSTFDNLLVLEPGRESYAEKTLILQSEVENLEGMVRECMEREPPTLVWLCYFKANRPGRDLEKLPPDEKLKKIRRVYENEFVQRMKTCLTDCIQEASRLRDASGRVDRDVEILFSREPKNITGELKMSKTRSDYEKQAEDFLISLCQL